MAWLQTAWGLDDWRLWLLWLLVSLLIVLLLMPSALVKLRGANITGKDRHKPGRPDVAEMGGLTVFAALMAGGIGMLATSGLGGPEANLALAAFVVVSGAAVIGILDDLISLQQRFKAALPLGFAIPLALFVSDTAVWFPWVGNVDFGVWYPLVLIPLGIGCASNGFNMLEGFNGLGAGITLITALALSALAILEGRYLGLLVLLPLAGATLGFLFFNFYPASVFPGDTGTLTMGTALAVGAMLSKLELAGALMFLLIIAEFLIKARNRFPTTGWGGDLRDGILYCPPRRPVGLGQLLLRLTGGLHERNLVLLFYFLQTALCAVIVVAFGIL